MIVFAVVVVTGRWKISQLSRGMLTLTIITH